MTSVEKPLIGFTDYQIALSQVLRKLGSSEDSDIQSALALTSHPSVLKLYFDYDFSKKQEGNHQSPNQQALTLADYINQHCPPGYLDALKLIDDKLLQILADDFGITPENCPFLSEL